MKKNSFLNYVNLGWNMIAGVALFTFGGYFLEKKFHVAGGILTGVMLGMVYCGYLIWKIIKNTE